MKAMLEEFEEVAVKVLSKDLILSAGFIGSYGASVVNSKYVEDMSDMS